MTDKELMQQALEALEALEYAAERIGCPDDDDAIGVARKALRERLAQPETVMAEYKFQTYAAYKADGEMKIGVVPDDAPLTLNGVPLYPRREWVGLTQEDWLALGCKTNEEIRVGLAIQARLKEKNA